jgi:hypothetical protein
VAPRTRIIAFGSATAVVAVGAICAATLNGLAGQLIAIILITFGLGALLLLVFLEVGLSEDRAREREEEQRRRERAPRPPQPRRRPRLSRRPRRPL